LNEPIRALGYVPRQDGEKEGMVTKYTIYQSQDGKKWQLIKEGEFSNIKSNPTEQIITFDTLQPGSYLKFEPKETINRAFTVAEFNLYL